MPQKLSGMGYSHQDAGTAGRGARDWAPSVRSPRLIRDLKLAARRRGHRLSMKLGLVLFRLLLACNSPALAHADERRGQRPGGASEVQCAEQRGDVLVPTGTCCAEDFICGGRAPTSGALRGNAASSVQRWARSSAPTQRPAMSCRKGPCDDPRRRSRDRHPDAPLSPADMRGFLECSRPSRRCSSRPTLQAGQDALGGRMGRRPGDPAHGGRRGGTCSAVAGAVVAVFGVAAVL